MRFKLWEKRILSLPVLPDLVMLSVVVVVVAGLFLFLFLVLYPTVLDNSSMTTALVRVSQSSGGSSVNPFLYFAFFPLSPL